MFTSAIIKVVLEAFLNAFGSFLNDFFGRKRADQNAQELGQARVSNRVNVETLEIKNAMDDVARPSDDAVADSLRTGKF
jgi:hypothetical protein